MRPPVEKVTNPPSMSIHMESIGHVANECMNVRVKTPPRPSSHSVFHSPLITWEAET